MHEHIEGNRDQKLLDELQKERNAGRSPSGSVQQFPHVQKVKVLDLDISMVSMIWLVIKAIPAIAIGSFIFYGTGYLLFYLLMSGWEGF